MTKITKEHIYSKLPIFLQNMAISAYGYKLNKVQRGGDYNFYLKKLIENISLNKDEIYSLQLKRLREQVSLCERWVPFYKELFEKESLSSDKVKTLDDLRKFPLLEKGSLRLNATDFINQQYKLNGLLNINTSGSTGTPLKVYYSPSSRQMNYAFYDRFLFMANIKYSGRRATFGGRLVVSQHQEKAPFWRFSKSQKNMIFSTYHMQNKNLLSYVDQLKLYSPDYIEAYPSAISILARYIIDNNIDARNITSVIVTSAETLMSDQRALIEEAFGVPVVDQYGSSEMSAFIGQCREGRYHAHSDYGIIEYLRSDGTIAKPGEEAEIVCTGFINQVMPLLRYRIGDSCVFSDEPCGCGLHFPVIEKILGRVDDAIVTPDGRRISRFGAVVYGLPVCEVQYVQRRIDELTVKIVKSSGYCDDTERNILKRLKSRFGNQINIDFVYVDMLERSAGGKLKSVISRVNGDNLLAINSERRDKSYD